MKLNINESHLPPGKDRKRTGFRSSERSRAVKFDEVKKLEKIDRAVGFIFSRWGFTGEAEVYCHENGIACSEDARWLEK